MLSYICPMEWIFTLDTIRQTAFDFWEETAPSMVFAFHGEMGAGKTTFIHALCDVKGVKDIVGSPTFSIINEYEIPADETNTAGKSTQLFHLDLYRLKSEEEALQAGVEDVLYSGALALVEWPEKAPCIFPDNTMHVFIELIDAKTRSLKISNK